MKKHIVELIMGCLLLICFYYLSREAAAVSVEMNQKQVIVVDCGHGGMDPGMIGIDGLKEKGCKSCHWPESEKCIGKERFSGGYDQGNRRGIIR